MKTRRLSILFSLTLILLAVACNLPGGLASPTPNLVATIVAATLQGLTSPTPRATSSPLETPTVFSMPTMEATFTLNSPQTAIPSVTSVPSVTATPGLGALTGGVYGYPYGTIPRLVFVASNQETGYWKYWINVEGLSYYSTENFIPAGMYQVLAYDAAGHAGGCVTIVTVKANEIAVCDITDWIGAYPGKPGDVPNP